MTKHKCRLCGDEYEILSQAEYCEEKHQLVMPTIERFAQRAQTRRILKRDGSIDGTRVNILWQAELMLGSKILVARIREAVLGKDQYKEGSWSLNQQCFIGCKWREEPELQDIPVLISLGVPPVFLEEIEALYKQRQGRRLKGLTVDPEKVKRILSLSNNSVDTP